MTDASAMSFTGAKSPETKMEVMEGVLLGFTPKGGFLKHVEIVHNLLINHCTCLNIPQLILTASPCQMFGDTEGTRNWRCL